MSRFWAIALIFGGIATLLLPGCGLFKGGPAKQVDAKGFGGADPMLEALNTAQKIATLAVTYLKEDGDPDSALYCGNQTVRDYFDRNLLKTPAYTLQLEILSQYAFALTLPDETWTHPDTQISYLDRDKKQVVFNRKALANLGDKDFQNAVFSEAYRNAALPPLEQPSPFSDGTDVIQYAGRCQTAYWTTLHTNGLLRYFTLSLYSPLVFSDGFDGTQLKPEWVNPYAECGLSLNAGLDQLESALPNANCGLGLNLGPRRNVVLSFTPRSNAEPLLFRVLFRKQVSGSYYAIEFGKEVGVPVKSRILYNDGTTEKELASSASYPNTTTGFAMGIRNNRLGIQNTGADAPFLQVLDTTLDRAGAIEVLIKNGSMKGLGLSR